MANTLCTEWTSRITELVGADYALFDEPMAAHTTFRIGGPAQAYVRPGSVAELAGVLAACREFDVPWRVIGLGSDLLVSDAGVVGAVIEVGSRMARIEVDGCRVRVEAGASNAEVARAACEAGLSGYEFASGIPGTVGGAAIMNAGAYDGEFKDVCESVTCLDAAERVIEVPAAEAGWAYRESVFDKAGYVVVGAVLRLFPDSPRAIRTRMDDLARRRAEKQPIDLPSAGSTFKRPAGHYAAALIDQAGLRGVRVGGAQVSAKHTGFLVNAGGATAADVTELIALVQRRVLENSGVSLEPEVRMWGF